MGRTSVPRKYNEEAMTRRNYHFPDLMIERLAKLAKREGTTVAALLREGGNWVIADRVKKIQAERAAHVG